MDIIVLDMRNLVNFCDYFVIASGTSDRQANAIAEHIEEELGRMGIRVKAANGKVKSNWIVFDAGDVVAHVFHKDARNFYALESLWQEAKQVNWNS